MLNQLQRIALSVVNTATAKEPTSANLSVTPAQATMQTKRGHTNHGYRSPLWSTSLDNIDLIKKDLYESKHNFFSKSL